jgi:hypothetical protein
MSLRSLEIILERMYPRQTPVNSPSTYVLPTFACTMMDAGEFPVSSLSCCSSRVSCPAVTNTCGLSGGVHGGRGRWQLHMRLMGIMVNVGMPSNNVRGGIPAPLCASTVPFRPSRGRGTRQEYFSTLTRTVAGFSHRPALWAILVARPPPSCARFGNEACDMTSAIIPVQEYFRLMLLDLLSASLNTPSIS